MLNLTKNSQRFVRYFSTGSSHKPQSFKSLYHKPKNALFNFVGRDHAQERYGNLINPAHPLILESAALWDQLNKLGPALFGYYEGGGAEPQVRELQFDNSFASLAAVRTAMPNGTPFRILTRGSCGWDIKPKATSDLEVLMRYMQKITTRPGQDAPVLIKGFDAQNNFDEVMPLMNIVNNMAEMDGLSVQLESVLSYIASHSSEYLKNKANELLAMISLGGKGKISIKSMVGDLDPSRACELAHLFLPLCKRSSLTAPLGIHCHNPTGLATEVYSKFIFWSLHYGYPVDVDVIHDQGDTFTGFFELINHLKKDYAIDVGITNMQRETLMKINKLRLEVDKLYECVKTPAFFPGDIAAKIGIPGGGISSTVKGLFDVDKIDEKLKLSREETVTLYAETYEQVRRDLQFVSTVTPWHSYVDTMVKIIMLNTKSGLQGLARYQGIPDHILNDLRKNRFPGGKIQPDLFRYFCQQHMRNILNKPDYNSLPNDAKDVIIRFADDKEAVYKCLTKHIADGEMHVNQLDTLVAESGERGYILADHVQPQADANLKHLQTAQQGGAPIKNIHEAQVRSLILSQDAITISAWRGPMPDPAGKTKAQWQAECQDYSRTMHLKNNPDIERLTPDVIREGDVEALTYGL